MSDSRNGFNAECVEVGAFQVNCWLLWMAEHGQCLVVDPGANPDRVLEAVQSRGLEVAAYVLTHGHMDHVSALAALHAQAPAPVALHPRDAAWAFTPRNVMLPFYPQPERPAAEERELADGREYNDGGMRYVAIGTPGHTPGSVCLLFPEHNALITGDTLFMGSVGRTDLPGGDSRALAASLRKLAALEGDLTVYPGHGPTTTLAQEKRTNYFMQAPDRVG